MEKPETPVPEAAQALINGDAAIGHQIPFATLIPPEEATKVLIEDDVDPLKEKQKLNIESSQPDLAVHWSTYKKYLSVAIIGGVFLLFVGGQ